ncbi:MAG: SusC/RagA family TonB-linked outer membrane protein [Marinifilaceae bacterium]
MKKQTTLLICIMFLVLNTSFAQSKLLTGKVIDTSGNVIYGAKINIKGFNNGTKTDVNGKWALSVSSKDTVMISFIGMKSRELVIGKSLFINIILEKDFVKKAFMPYGILSVDEEKLSRFPEISPEIALSSINAGVEVSGGLGQLGSPSSIKIRGVSSINQHSKPLYVVDDVVILNDNSNLGVLSYLNEKDIASIYVLKNAEALYGSRASNGAVIIKTKRGGGDGVKFSLNTEYTFKDFAVNTAELASSREAFDYKVEGYKNNLVEYKNKEDNDATYHQARDFITQYFNKYDDTRPASDYDWKSALFRKNPVLKNIQFSVSVGNKKTKLFSSISYAMSDGIALGSDFKRFTARLNIEHKINKIMSAGFKTSLASIDQNTINTYGYLTKNPMYSTKMILNQLIPIKEINGAFNNIYSGNISNPVEYNKLNSEYTNIWKNNNQAYISLRLFDCLDFKSTNSIKLWRIPSYKKSEFKFGELDINDSYKKHMKLITSNTVKYYKTFDIAHRIDISAAYEYEYLDSLFSSEQKTDKYFSNESDKIYSFLSSFKYVFRDKYNLNINYRTDGCSRLDAKTKWSDFYSISGVWRISQENFIQNLSFLNEWKLKVSYAYSEMSEDSWLSHQRVEGLDTDLSYRANKILIDPNINIENSNTLSFATDVNILDFLNVRVEYFHKKTKDFMKLVPMYNSSGFEAILNNIGEMTNKGFEISLSSKNLKNSEIHWNTNLVLAHYSNTIDKIYGGADVKLFPNILREGKSYNSIYTRDWAGVDKLTGHGRWYVLENEKRVDKDNDGRMDTTENIQEARNKIVGAFDPDIDGSITNLFSYKGIDLSFTFSFRLGGDALIYPSASLYDDGTNINKPVLKSNLNHWKKPGDISDLPKNVFLNPQCTDYISSRMIVDASYLRLKNISLAYNLPKSILQSIHLTNVRFYATAKNLWTLSKMNDFDPELSFRGEAFNNFSFPSLKTLTFGLQVNF